MNELEARVLEAAPDESDAKSRLERIIAAAEYQEIDLQQLNDDTVLVLRLACQRAPYLATLLARDPSRLQRIEADAHLRRAKDGETVRTEIAERLKGVDDEEEFDHRLRVYRGDEMVRLGIREIELGTPFEVGEELSQLADQCIDAAIEFHDQKLRKRYGAPRYTDVEGNEHDAKLAVIGMGKLGGEELNFCSDVDLIYLYSSDDGQAGELSLHEYFAKLCKQVSGSIGDVTAEDSVFRVDLRLRPEGSRGTIANSLASMEAYYEAYGRPWERQAWIKARCCAGDQALGDEIISILRPFVYPRNLAPSVLDDVRGLNERIKNELTGGSVDTGFDLKNGIGGIREIEFFAQGLQLIHAGQRPKLQTRSTITALDELLFSGLITEEERHGLASAYRFLRHLEHMVQLDSGRQTQRLPTEPKAIRLLALRTGHADVDALALALEQHTSEVAASFATLGEAPEGPPIEVKRLLRGSDSKEQEQSYLATLGFADPLQAWADFDRVRRKKRSPFASGAKGQAAEVAPLLLAELATSPDPDQALRHVGALIGRRGSWSAIWGMMHDNHELLRLIASLFGTSEYLSKTFIRHPELLDSLLGAGLGKARYDRSETSALLAARDIFALNEREQQWNTLAEFKNTQVLRIGLADIAGALDAEEVCEQLSDLADVCVQCALSMVEDDLKQKHGIARTETGEEIRLAVLAMGKLGGQELGYASDLDIVFVYSGEGESDGTGLDSQTYMSRIAQRLMSGLHSLHPGGRLYEVDTRLRPSGSQGLLVSSMAAWNRYHRKSAQLWERQSLTKLRWIAGSQELGGQAVQSTRSLVYNSESNPSDISRGIAEMRNRIWQELVAPQRRIDVKAGHGGIIDIEFAAQYLQLAYGHSHPSLQTTSTMRALEAAATLNLAPPETCGLLLDGYRFLRRIEHRLRMVHDRSEHHMPAEDSELDKLARRAGYPDGPQLKAAFHRWTRDLHQAYREILGLA